MRCIPACLVGTLPGGEGMMALVPPADWREIWTTAPAEDRLLILDPAKGEVVGTVEIPGDPHGLVLSPDGTRAYMVQRKLNQLAIVDTASRRVIKTAQVGKRPDMLAISSDGATLYVTSRNENKLLVVSASDWRSSMKWPPARSPMAWPIANSRVAAPVPEPRAGKRG